MTKPNIQVKKSVTIMMLIVALLAGVISIYIGTTFAKQPGVLITINALNEKNELAEGTGIEIIGFKVDGRFIPAKNQKKEGIWKENRSGYLYWESNDKVDNQTDAISFWLPEGRERYIVANSNKLKGYVSVSTEGMQYVIDMYSQNVGETEYRINATTPAVFNWAEELSKALLIGFIVFSIEILLYTCIEKKRFMQMLKENKKREKNICLNTLKGFACIGVVFGHCSFPGTIGKVLSIASICAVPAFTMIAGYYCFSDNSNEVQLSILRKTQKIFIIFFGASIGSIAINIYIDCVLGSMTLKHWIQQMFNVKNFLGLFINTDVTFAGNGVLWYLVGMLLCYLFILVINTYNLYDLSYWLIPITFLFNILYQLRLFGGYLVLSQFLHYMFPYFLVGHVIAKHNQTIKKKLTNSKGLIIIIISFLMAWVLYNYDRTRRLDELAQIPYSISMFLFATINSERSISRVLMGIGEKYSLYIFIMHMLISKVINYFAVSGGIVHNAVYQWYRPVIILLLCIVVTNMLLQIKQNIIKI